MKSIIKLIKSMLYLSEEILIFSLVGEEQFKQKLTVYIWISLKSLWTSDRSGSQMCTTVPDNLFLNIYVQHQEVGIPKFNSVNVSISYIL